MTDLNSLSKEELIKLVAQKEEQLRAAEDLAEKRERSNIKFAHGVTSLALLLKDLCQLIISHGTQEVGLTEKSVTFALAGPKSS